MHAPILTSEDCEGAGEQFRVSTLTRHVSKDALFDIGADTVGLIVPGGSIAVKLARLAIDRNY